MQSAKPNRRVLIVDDEEVVRDSLRESLQPRPVEDGGLAAAASALFGSDAAVQPKRAPDLFAFEVDEAINGREAFEKVRQAVAEGRPYAVVFLDMRMPGWDGLETVVHIREVDRRAEVVFVTAYSDHSITEIVEQAGPNVGYYCKPFSPDEIRQVANKAVHDWNRNRDLECLIRMVSGLRARSSEIDTLLRNILEQVSQIVGARSSMLCRIGGSNRLSLMLATGDCKDPAVAEPLIARISSLLPAEHFPVTLSEDRVVVLKLDNYHIVALLEHSRGLNSEKLYLLTLFVESASRAIENTMLQEEVARKERLSALGQALGSVVHDLRNPIGAIRMGAEMVEDLLAQKDYEAVPEFQRLILQSSEDAMDLLNDVLDFTRGNRVERAPIPAVELTELIREKCAPLFRETTVRFEVENHGVEEVRGDAKKLLRVVLNIVRNAIEAMRDARSKDPCVRLILETAAHNVILRIADNGPGIPAQMTGHLFEPFATHGKEFGTGLGLAIVKQIVDAHGGSIDVATSPRGTTFVVVLPH